MLARPLNEVLSQLQFCRAILALIEAGTFTVGGRQVLDAETLGEVRQWAARRVAACEARIAACDKYH